jgi:hypothetical protein
MQIKLTALKRMQFCSNSVENFIPKFVQVSRKNVEMGLHSAPAACTV